MTADMLELDIGDDSIHTQESGSYPNVTVSSQSVIQDRTLHSTRQAEVIAPMSAPLYPTPSSPVPNFHPADAPSQPEACFEQVEQHAHTENPQESQPAYTRASSLVAPPAEDFISPQTNGPNEEVPDSTNARVEESIDQEMLASNQNTPHVDSLCWPSNLNTYHAKFDVIEESEKIELFAQGLEGSLVTFSRKRLKKGWIESSEEQMARRESNKGFYAILPKKLSEAGDAYNREGDPVECYITNAIYIHCLGLRASTYFQTRRWEIENDPKEPCSLGNFILATPATSSHNFHAASVFWTSFQQATKAEFYEVRKMGRYYTEDSVRHLFRVVVDAQIAFQTAAHSNTASEEDRNHYRRERSNARRIAKWISLCFVAEFSGQKMLLENIRIGGADLCSSEESGVDENEDVILKTKLLSWRSQKLENFLSLLRQRTLYYKGPPNGSQANQHKKSERIPPVHVPKDWVHTSWLESIPTRL
ncbi:hypothetical protein CPB86DRAFT_358170 [Serendipita vermifera]|nr:hypothetical protein CPB86DRAFT_358170 [Serendipita vermifera]